MKQIIIWVLALGMCSINVSAQTKEYEVEDDGFEWYKISENGRDGALDKYGNTLIPPRFDYISYDSGIFCVESNDRYGAYDTKGNMIIPTEYDRVSNIRDGILVMKGDNEGIYNKHGRCLIPVSRGYKYIIPYETWWKCYHSKYEEKGKRSICDASGKVVFSTRRECNNVWIQYDSTKKKYAIIVDDKYFVDVNDNVVLDPQCYKISHGLEGIDNMWIKKVENGTERKLTQAEKSKVIFSGDIFEGNKEYFASLERMEKGTNTNNSSSSSSSSSNNNESGGSTTTIVIEHPQTPQPFQEWQQCTNCWGEGKVMCLGACGGTGTYYVGDRLHICNSCGGKGKKICPNCGGQGGKYVTVYR